MGDLGILVPLAPFLMVVGIVWVKSHAKLEEKRIAATAESSAEKGAQYASRIAEMEDRIRVLERIVTDSGYNVASQIEALRDTRRVEQQLEDNKQAFALEFVLRQRFLSAYPLTLTVTPGLSFGFLQRRIGVTPFIPSTQESL